MILFQAIRQARSSIHLVMFGLTDLPLIQALEERAREGIAVDIFYEKEASSPLSTLIPHAQTHPVKAKGLMHQKILIVDRETVFIGSANMTPSSLRMHDNLIVAFRHPKAADFLISHTPRSAGSYHARIGGQPLDIWLLPDPRGHAIEALRALLRSAHKTIQIALFTFTHSSLVDELIAAKKRGVHVSVLFDMHAGLGSSGRTLETLRKAGIQILTSRGPQLMHHKFLYVDGHTLLTGSANWTQAAFSKNSDCFVILRHLTPEQKTFVDRLWQKMELLSKEIVPNRS
jgi:phosphatidylserine/phosphatidylglycerophosphate/cardiolipin synthase-like enzyme